MDYTNQRMQYLSPSRRLRISAQHARQAVGSQMSVEPSEQMDPTQLPVIPNRPPAISSQYSNHPSSPTVHPQFRSKTVCKLFCRHCADLMCNRGMKAILLGNTKVELYSTDSPPSGVQLVYNDYSTQNCSCRIRDAACLRCGNVVGYHVTQPCAKCLDACNNGHFWMFLSDGVRPEERYEGPDRLLRWATLLGDPSSRASGDDEGICEKGLTCRFKHEGPSVVRAQEAEKEEPVGNVNETREALTCSGCPVCREASPFIVPSSIFPATEEHKKALVDRYKDTTSKIPCRYFKMSRASDECLYGHFDEDGNKVSNVRKPEVRQRLRMHLPDILAEFMFEWKRRQAGFFSGYSSYQDELDFEIEEDDDFDEYDDADELDLFSDEYALYGDASFYSMSPHNYADYNDDSYSDRSD
ncbi:Protein fam72a [Dinochytrium kinnereticum]|nr:Protein fam72a [Dinochytrium kinnereticum]